jgi:predicted RNase H-like nuclease (RuvC/YqgF family)
MEWLFGRGSAAALKEAERQTARADRDLDRQLDRIRREEEKLTRQLKEAKRRNDDEEIEQLATEIAKLQIKRHNIQKLRGQNRNQRFMIMDSRSTLDTIKTIKTVASAAKTVNRQLSGHGGASVIARFEHETTAMSTHQEALQEAIADACISGEDEEEIANIVGRVKLEHGIAIAETFPSTPAPAEESTGESEQDTELQERFARLGRP